nr:hypothetical protein ACMD2_08441 [Ipomoea batatas]
MKRDHLRGVRSLTALMAIAPKKKMQQRRRQYLGSEEKPSTPKMAMFLYARAKGAGYCESGSPRQSCSGNGGDCDVAAKREPGRNLVLEENLSSALIVERGSRVWVAGGRAVGDWDYAAGALFLELSGQGNQRSAQNFEEIVKGKGSEDIYMYPVTLDAMEAGVAGFSIPITFSVLDKRPHYTPRKNCANIPVLSKNAVHVFTKKNPSSPADTLSEGMIPVVRLNFITITVNNTPNPRLTTKALIVNWFCHGGTSLSLKIISTDSTPPTSFFSPKPSSFNSSFLIIRSADPFSTLSPFVELSIFQLRAEL